MIMAITTELPESVSLDIARQLESGIHTLGAIEREVGETFPIWEIDGGLLSTNNSRTAEVAKNIARATSMIYMAGDPHFAIEARLLGAVAEVTTVSSEISQDGMAVKFRAAFDAIERDLPEADGVVRQLEASSYRFIALWVVLSDADWIYPIEPGVTELLPSVRYSWAEVHDRLVHCAPVRGLILK